MSFIYSSISTQTGAIVYLDKEDEKYPERNEKTIIVNGTREQAEKALKQIEGKF